MPTNADLGIIADWYYTLQVKPEEGFPQVLLTSTWFHLHPRNQCDRFHWKLITPMRQKGISKLEGGLIPNPYREITGENRAINMLIITLLTKPMW